MNIDGIDETTFWSKIRVAGPNDCWEWQAAHVPLGYGRFRAGSMKDGTRRLVVAHRAAYELTKGPIPDGLFVCHSCDNPKCCNPAHLWVGTAKDNNMDKSRKGKAVSPACKGVRNGRSKLTDGDVVSIRGEYKPELKNGYKLAQKYGVSAVVIYSVVNGRRWTHVK